MNTERILYMEQQEPPPGQGFTRHASAWLERSSCRKYWQTGNGWHRFVLDDFGDLVHIPNTDARVHELLTDALDGL